MFIQFCLREEGPNDDVQHIQGGQQCGDHQTGDAAIGEAVAAIHRCCGQIPLADKAGQAGNTHQTQSRHREAAKDDLHLLAAAIHVIDVGLSGLVHKGTGAPERGDLHKTVEYEVGQRANQTQGGHDGCAEDDVRQVTDRRPCQPPFDVGLFDRAAATINNGKHGNGHADILHPGSPQELCADAVVGQANDGKGTGIDHSYRVQ